MKKKSKAGRAIPIAISLAVGGGIGYLGAIVGSEAAKSVPGWVMVLLVVLFIPAFFFVIAVHEGGHAWAGAQVNFDFRMYVVGPFLWDKQADGWKFKWNKNINTAGGFVICIPTGTDNLAKRFSFYAAGGPLASVMLALVAFGLSQLPSVFALAWPAFTSIMLMIAVLSALIFMVTAIPFHTGGFSSDGARVLRFMRGGDTARFEVLMLKIVSTSMAGVRPNELNLDELQEAKALGEKLQMPMAVYMNYFLYTSALDRNERGAAELHLNEYVQAADEVPEGLRGGVWLEAAFFYAAELKELAKAAEYFALYKPSALTPLAVEYATRAALAKLKGAEQEFNTWSEKAVQALPAMMDRGSMLLVRERLATMKAED
jgi:hypothetical protein